MVNSSLPSSWKVGSVFQDDVMQSGLRASSAPPPDVTKRSDTVVLSKPKGLPSINGAAGQAVLQSSAEALASLVEEMKKVLSAPGYDNTPLLAKCRPTFLDSLGRCAETVAEEGMRNYWNNSNSES